MNEDLTDFPYMQSDDCIFSSSFKRVVFEDFIEKNYEIGEDDVFIMNYLLILACSSCCVGFFYFFFFKTYEDLYARHTDFIEKQHPKSTPLKSNRFWFLLKIALHEMNLIFELKIST